MNEEELGDSFRELFVWDDRYVLLYGRSLSGDDGFPAMQLIANCLRAVSEDNVDETLGISPSSVPGGIGPMHERLAQVEAHIRHVRNTEDAEFVLAFHIAGTETWKLGWSHNMDSSEAIQAMQTCVRCNLTFND